MGIVQSRRSLFLAGIFFIVAASLQIPQADAQSGEAETHRQSGLDYFREGQFGPAVQSYRRALALAPGQERLYLELADIHLAAGLPEEAESVLAEAAGRFPNSVSPHYNLLYHDLAELWAASGRIGKARQAMERASRVDGPVAAAVIHKRLGDFSTDLLRFNDALAAYRKALDLNADSPAARLALGNLHLRRDSLDEALSEFTLLLALSPDHPAGFHGMAEVYWRRSQFEEAVQAAGSVLARAPGHAGALYIRGSANIRLGRRAEGERDLKEYRVLEARKRAEEERRRNIQAFRSGGMDLVLRGRYEEAIELFEAGIAAHPDAAVLYLHLGQAESELGRHQDAIKTFLEWLQRGIGDGHLAHRELAREYLRVGDTGASARHRALYEAGLAAKRN